MRLSTNGGAQARWRSDGSELLRAFDRGDDGWAIAAWLASPHAALDGERPIDRVRTARDLDRIARLAGDASRRWAS